MQEMETEISRKSAETLSRIAESSSKYGDALTEQANAQIAGIIGLKDQFGADLVTCSNNLNMSISNVAIELNKALGMALSDYDTELQTTLKSLTETIISMRNSTGSIPTVIQEAYSGMERTFDTLEQKMQATLFSLDDLKNKVESRQKAVEDEKDRLIKEQQAINAEKDKLIQVLKAIAEKEAGYQESASSQLNEERQRVNDSSSKLEAENKAMDNNEEIKEEASSSNNLESETTSSKAIEESDSNESDEFSFPDFSKI